VGVEEDGAHLFVKCKAVKDVWRKGGMEDIRLKLKHLESATQTLDVIWELSERDHLQICRRSY
jgi:hypothetical protein